MARRFCRQLSTLKLLRCEQPGGVTTSSASMASLSGSARETMGGRARPRAGGGGGGDGGEDDASAAPGSEAGPADKGGSYRAETAATNAPAQTPGALQTRLRHPGADCAGAGAQAPPSQAPGRWSVAWGGAGWGQRRACALALSPPGSAAAAVSGLPPQTRQAGLRRGFGGASRQSRLRAGFYPPEFCRKEAGLRVGLCESQAGCCARLPLRL